MQRLLVVVLRMDCRDRLSMLERSMRRTGADGTLDNLDEMEKFEDKMLRLNTSDAASVRLER